MMIDLIRNCDLIRFIVFDITTFSVYISNSPLFHYYI